MEKKNKNTAGQVVTQQLYRVSTLSNLYYTLKTSDNIFLH